MTWKRYMEAEHKLNQGLIRLDRSLSPSFDRQHDPTAKMAEMGDFLAECGNPQLGIPTVHVAGTSGKGNL